MDNYQIRELIKNLRITMRCPRCGKRYNLEEIFLKKSIGATHFLQLNCSSCRTPVYATISVNGNLAKTQPNLVTKKSNIIDARKIPVKSPNIKKEKISTNDIIEMHQFLSKHQGNFTNLF